MNGIGQTLKEAREKKGLTLDDLQQTTKIQKRYLIAIEAENFDALPGDFYVRAFIQQYAKVVDLDGDELLAQLEEKQGSKLKLRLLMKRRRGQRRSESNRRKRMTFWAN